MTDSPASVTLATSIHRASTVTAYAVESQKTSPQPNHASTPEPHGGGVFPATGPPRTGRR